MHATIAHKKMVNAHTIEASQCRVLKMASCIAARLRGIYSNACQVTATNAIHTMHGTLLESITDSGC
jgi:hypothetical protein